MEYRIITQSVKRSMLVNRLEQLERQHYEAVNAVDSEADNAAQFREMIPRIENTISVLRSKLDAMPIEEPKEEAAE